MLSAKSGVKFMELDKRKQEILCAVIKAYIETGEPIGSKALIEREGLAVSSATVRSEMSELERLGFLRKPHTSAGRIPSNEGYRFYITTALSDYRLNRDEEQILSLPDFDPKNLDGVFHQMVQALAEFSGCTVFALSPVCRDGCFTFEIMPVGENSAVIMAVASDSTVKTCFCRLPKRPTPDECMVLTKIFNSVLSGFPADNIGDVRLLLLEHEIAAHCPHMKQIVASAKELVGQLKAYTLHIGGSTNLLSYPEFANIETAREFISLLDRHEQIVNALRKDFYQGNITIKIGRENLVFDSPYASMIEMVPGSGFPVMLSVMGPTRMDYSRIIAGCNHLFGYIKKVLGES